MKTKKFSKKLTLSKTTINTLDAQDQSNVYAGGYPTYNMPTCYGAACGVDQTDLCPSAVWWNC